MEIIMMNNM